MELEEFKQKFNLPRINDYVALLSESQKNWFWEQLMEIKQVFPNIDIYHAGASKYGYLGFGRKRVQAKRVEDFLFVLHLEKNGNFILYIADQTYRLLRVDEDVLPQGYDQSVQKELNLKDWLDQVKTFTEELDLDYSGEDLYPVNYEVEDYFTTLEAYNFLKTKYQKIKEATKKIVGFRNNSNRELALILENSRPSLFIGVDPEDNQYFKFNFIDNNSKIFGKYDENEGRHDGLKSHAPSLYKGNKAYYIEINSLSDLEKFCEWYELAIQNSLTNSHPKEDKEMPDQIIVQPLNRILFGAAGTGKTFNTINHALSIIENKSLEKLETENREELKKRFDGYKEKGQIKFVTFHQSFSYEDFVEGIRAESDEDGNLNYLVKDGVFKEISIDAQIEVDAKKIAGNVPTDFSINSAIDQLIERAKQTEQVFYTKRKAEIKVTSNSSGTLFALNSQETTITLSIRHIKNYLKTQQDNIVDNKAYEWAIAKSLRSEVEYEKPNSDSEPYVLIIDEINRGNISRIFGELITLIEDSKRAGADEELSVTLPYSKQEFIVPNNVYIIGTMNSSDRSLTGLDIALRRRFTFIEMSPQPKLLEGVNVDGIDIERLLTVINQRIEALLDRDHCIGHANFMSLKKQPTLENLTHIFKQKIIPQLQEYFFDDWAKINLVLNGNGMFHSKPIEKSAIFPNVDSEELGYFEDKKSWELVPTSFDNIESFAKIIQH
ncbi:5-methylcytosine-specific restriction enzyme B [Acinetobacter venetianus]|uniref:5-methylcytosine-specific restriction enzyme B n=1 Tax=Acinetobacter venetianus TaxID=52133 RepID=A0A150I1A5_9GAMM|nr:AAA family ATPase [Acinetobacter venetianus]KXZ73303.1 5-methylcytosine-specific restriction enzyme B [Acinetobacter venetianus]